LAVTWITKTGDSTHARAHVTRWAHGLLAMYRLLYTVSADLIYLGIPDPEGGRIEGSKQAQQQLQKMAPVPVRAKLCLDCGERMF